MTVTPTPNAADIADATRVFEETRTYRVELKRDLRGWGLDWHVHTSGSGHWCVGGREAGAFRSETEAHAAGRRWVETGRMA